MSFKLLVIGDSFARLDDVQRHWADLWIESYGGSAIHIGMPGSNAVNIVNEFEFIYKDREWDFDGAVFHIPDFFRTEVLTYKYDPKHEEPNGKLKCWDMLTQDILIEHTLNGDQDLQNLVSDYLDPYSLEPSQIYYYLMSRDPESANSKKFFNNSQRSQRDQNMLNAAINHYNTASPRWLARANYHALKNFNLQMTINNKPVCFIFNPGVDSPVFDHYLMHFNGLSNIWHMNIISENIGDNHVSIENAQICAEMFDSYNKTAKIFPI